MRRNNQYLNPGNLRTGYDIYNTFGGPGYGSFTGFSPFSSGAGGFFGGSSPAALGAGEFGGGIAAGNGGAGAAMGGAMSALPFIGAAYMGLDALGVKNQQGQNPMFSGAGLPGQPQGGALNTIADPDNLLGGIFGLGGGDGLSGMMGGK